MWRWNISKSLKRTRQRLGPMRGGEVRRTMFTRLRRRRHTTSKRTIRFTSNSSNTRHGPTAVGVCPMGYPRQFHTPPQPSPRQWPQPLPVGHLDLIRPRRQG